MRIIKEEIVSTQLSLYGTSTSQFINFFFTEQYHGFDGPLRIEIPDYVGLGPDFVKAGQEFGFPERDLNAPFTEGKFSLPNFVYSLFETTEFLQVLDFSGIQ